MIRIDGKHTVWRRIKIPTRYEEALKKFLEENPEATFNSIYEWVDKNVEGITTWEDVNESAAEMTPEENGGDATVEVDVVYTEYHNKTKFLYRNVA